MIGREEVEDVEECVYLGATVKTRWWHGRYQETFKVQGAFST